MFLVGRWFFVCQIHTVDMHMYMYVLLWEVLARIYVTRQTAFSGWLAPCQPQWADAQLLCTCLDQYIYYREVQVGYFTFIYMYDVPTLYTLQFTVQSRKWIMPLWVVTSHSYCTPCRVKILVLMQYILTMCSGTWMCSPKLSKIKQRYIHVHVYATCSIHVQENSCIYMYLFVQMDLHSNWAKSCEQPGIKQCYTLHYYTSMWYSHHT